VIQDGRHLLVVLRYIEANPLRAGMVADPADYRWSSYQQHGLGHEDPLLNPFPEWEELGRTEAERRRRWRAKVRAAPDESELAAVRRSLQSGRPFGAADWTDRMAERLGIDLKPRPRGRPRKEARQPLSPQPTGRTSTTPGVDPGEGPAGSSRRRSRGGPSSRPVSGDRKQGRS
jgi:putative transposase